MQGAARPQAVQTRALVVGSGVTGSTCAFLLYQAGVTDVICTEARDEVGGNLISRSADDYLWEEGPNTFQPTPAILKLARDVGLESALVFADAKLPRYVFWDGVLHALPMSPADLVNGRFNLLTNAGKIRAALGALGFVGAPKRATGIAGHASDQVSDLDDESVEEFVTRHLGREVFLKLIDPFVSGVYAGDPSKLSMAAAFKRVYALEKLGGTRGILEGALIRLQQRRRERNLWAAENLPRVKSGALGSFQRGLQQLPITIQQLIGPERMRTNHRLHRIEFHGDQPRKRRYTAFFETPDGERTIETDALILTVPAYVASPLLQGIGVPGSHLLEEIESPPVYSVTLAYPKYSSRFPLSGFGNLIPRSAGIRTLGMVWSSSLFPGRAPPDMHMVLSYIGGARDQAIQQCTSDEVVRQVDADMRQILLRADAPSPRVLGVRLWPRAIPQYTRGHLRRLGECNQGLERFPGLYVGGNYVSGVSFGDCVQWAYDNIPRVLASLRASP
ncbi:hypothetical protein CCYA_CCYA19G4733 [Cyanidiococcus yangmingshanensis]|nr:hypothetical protein CCYA_CCYA19G4733 [Cyanidiococcus yangmingshanensis]